MGQIEKNIAGLEPPAVEGLTRAPFPIVSPYHFSSYGYCVEGKEKTDYRLKAGSKKVQKKRHITTKKDAIFVIFLLTFVIFKYRKGIEKQEDKSNFKPIS